MNTGNARVTLLLAAVLLGAAGCAPGGGSTASPAASATSASAATAITIRDFGYGAPLVVPAGAALTVTNMDSAEHTVSADDGSAFDVEVKGSGGTATFTAPSKPGTYAYHCRYHPNMHGTLTVR
ncbi:plastocyanin [Arthrobacter sp. KBS0702]|uniref:cupredoxin domain-containing protein n=1 Tax=Arthrobacter sp. KBS0702 TaxID=2578107 RepID=UPI00110F44B6|nr:cupredoxin domain-containing protein [Arthrobacter sp. KBS0702]QDW29652.1 plastocyanin [Arthrobacter sp. KBS0702]